MDVWIAMTLASRSAHSALPAHCEPSGPFLRYLSTHLNTCLPSFPALLSSLLGTLSVFAWLFAQVPQIYKNYKLKSASGLSIYFLLEWSLADIANLLGAIFLHQASWQIVVAAYYCTVDFTLVVQYIWYGRIRPQSLVVVAVNDFDPSDSDMMREVGTSPTTPVKSNETSPLLRRQGTNFSVPDYSAPSSPVAERSNPLDRSISPKRRQSRGGQMPSSPVASPKTFLFAATVLALCSPQVIAHPLDKPRASSQQPLTGLETAGTVLSWTSTILYLGSRFPQLYKNHRRRSTSGLSPLLFFAAFMGNFFYSASLLTNPLGWADFPPYGGGGWAGSGGSLQETWVKNALPFFLGAAGVLVMDGAVGLQFLVFGEESGKIFRDDQGRWHRVKGWMRGWMPSPNPSAAEQRALVTDPPEGYGTL
ncbi:MAG: hypothetical protein M1814_004485 [Vezdaea aestivalis]|nr:MAG: hypothetical protein M1814_004485 [Vezdaea aestivalis]